jgi:hypothetical protein
MIKAIEGTYENGTLMLEETPPTAKKSKVVVLFMEETSFDSASNDRKGVRLGALAGQYSIPNNFNDPIDDLSDYM